MRCADVKLVQQFIELIDLASVEGGSLGGVFETGAIGVLPGLGSHTGYDRRLDARLAGLLMSIPAIKAVEIGEGIVKAAKPRSAVHEEK